MSFCGTGGWTGPKPGDPDNNSVLTATPAFGGIDIAFTYPATNPHAVAYTKLYRGITPNFGEAIHSVVLHGNTYYDKLDSGTQYWYWIQIVSVNGTVGDVIGPATAVARPLINDLIVQLTGAIDSGVLAQSLRTEIDKITLNYGDLIGRLQSVSGDNAALSQALANVQQGIAEALALVIDERSIRQSGQTALIEQIDVIAALNEENAAAILVQEEVSVSRDAAYAQRIEEVLATVNDSLAAAVQTLNQAIADSNGAMAQQLSTAQTTLGNQIAGVQTTLQANIDTVGDTVTEIGALYSAKVSVNGLIGGFTVYNDGTEVEAGFDVDRFWVGRTGPDKKKPFIIQDDEVFINEAAINQLTITKLRDESGRLVVENGGLAIRDAQGNIIFSAGTPLDWSLVSGTNKPQDGATRNVNKGAWATATAYDLGDIVTYQGSSWSCKLAHVSSLGTSQPPALPTTQNTYWALWAAKGDPGINGTRTAVLEVYRWSANAPTTFPAGSSTYTWATGQFTAPGTLNGWSLTPPAPVKGQTLWVARQIYADSGSSATSSVSWVTSSAYSSTAAGNDGVNGANGWRTAVLELYRWSASAPTTFPSGTSTYTWATGVFTAPGTANGWSLVPGAPVAGQTLWACSVSYADTGTSSTSTVTWNTTNAYVIGAAGTNGTNGLNGLTVVVSNEAHILPASSTGAVSSYTRSGTTIQVFEGATALTASASATTSAFRIGTITQSPTSTITVGGVSYAGVTATVSQHSAMVDGTDSVVLTIPVTVYRANGTSVTIDKTQTLTKSKVGATGDPGSQGPAGPAVVLTPNRPASFTSTDGNLDGSQANIVFTANVSGITSPTYAWSFSGLQTNPTASTTNTQTITAAQFGTSKSAIVTVTVNGTIVDKMTIVRLERSTAEAGATVGADFGTVTRSSPTPLNFTARGGTISNFAFTKTATSGWGNADFYSNNGKAGAAYAEITASQNDGGNFVGMSSNPSASMDWQAIEYGLHQQWPSNALHVYESGVGPTVVGTCIPGDILSITYSGTSIVYKKNDTVLRTVSTTAGRTLYFDGTVHNQGGTVAGIRWEDAAPTVTKTGNVTGQITPENASTYIANAAIGAAQIGSLALVGTGNFSVRTALSGARMEMDSRAIKVYDATGVLRVQLGDLLA